MSQKVAYVTGGMGGLQLQLIWRERLAALSFTQIDGDHAVIAIVCVPTTI